MMEEEQGILRAREDIRDVTADGVVADWVKTRVVEEATEGSEIGLGKGSGDIGGGEDVLGHVLVPVAGEAVRGGALETRGVVVSVGELEAEVHGNAGECAIGDTAAAGALGAVEPEVVGEARDGGVDGLMLHVDAVAAKGGRGAVEKGVVGEVEVVQGPVPVGLGAGVAALLNEGRLKEPDEVAVPGEEPTLDVVLVGSWRANGLEGRTHAKVSDGSHVDVESGEVIDAVDTAGAVGRVRSGGLGLQTLHSIDVLLAVSNAQVRPIMAVSYWPLIRLPSRRLTIPCARGCWPWCSQSRKTSSCGGQGGRAGPP